MKHRLIALGLAAFVALPLLAECHRLDFAGWRMADATNYFLEDLRGVFASDTAKTGLSSARSFTVMATLTTPKTFRDYAGAISLGVPSETQLTLTFPGHNADGRPYISSAGLMDGTWYVPAATFNTRSDGGRKVAIALVHNVADRSIALWLDGEKVDFEGDGTPTLNEGAAITHLRLSGRMNDPQNGNAGHYFTGGAYADVAVFDEALDAAAIKTGSALAVAAGEDAVHVTLNADIPTAWDAAWNGKDVVISGTGTLTLGAATVVAQSAAPQAEPKTFTLTAGTNLTVSAPLGATIATEAAAAAPSASLAFAIAGIPAGTTTGDYGLIVVPDGTQTVAPGAVTLPASAANAELLAIDPEAGTFTVRVITQDTEGFWVLNTPEDYDWYLTQCPENAKVRLGADIVIAQSYEVADEDLSQVAEFDGADHTLTLAEGATITGTGANIGLVVTQARPDGTAVKNLKVVVAGTIAGGTSNLGAVVGFAGNGAAISVSNVHVIVSGNLKGLGSCGGIVGGYWATAANSIADCRVDLLADATLYGEDGYRGVGGVLGALRGGGGAVRDVLVVAQAGARVEGATASGRGLLVGFFDKTGTVENCAVVDLGAAGDNLAITAHGTPATWQATGAAATPGNSSPQPIELLSGTVAMGGVGTLAPILQGAGLTVADCASEAGIWTFTGDGGQGLTVAGTTATPDATDTLNYAVAVPAVTPPDGAVYDNLFRGTCTLSALTEDGFAVLDSEADYAWYLASCPENAKVRLGANITVTGDYSVAEANLDHVAAFDGANHTLTLAGTLTGTAESKNIAMIATAGNTNGGTSIHDLNVVVAGTIAGGTSNLGTIVGYSGSGYATTLANVHVTIAGTGKLEGAGSCGGLVGGYYGSGDSGIVNSSVRVLAGGEIVGEDGYRGVGGALGAMRNGGGTLSNVRVALEHGAVLSGSGSASGVGALVGYYDNKGVSAIETCAVLDKGVTFTDATVGDPTKAPFNAAVYTVVSAQTPYAVAAICLDGEQLVEQGRLTLIAGGTVALAGAEATEGWEVVPIAESNAVSIVAPASIAGGARGTLTYRVKGFEDSPFTLALAQPALVALPEGATAAQAAILRQIAAANGLGSATLALGEGAVLEAVERFEGVVAADAASGTLALDYDFGVTAIDIVGGVAEVSVALTSPSGTAGFADGTAVLLVPSEGEATLQQEDVTPADAPADTRRIRLTLTPGTCLFRAVATAAR